MSRPKAATLLPKKTNREIISLMKKRKFERIATLKKIEAILKRKRGYIFKMPPPKSDVIALTSCGLDSTINLCILLEKFRLKVHPLFINWGQLNLKQEIRAFNYFMNYFKKRYPRYLQKPQKINAHIPPKEIYDKRDDIVVLRNSLFAHYAVSYGMFLERSKKIKPRTVFLSSVATDGLMVPDTTLTAIRAVNLAICFNEADFSWQVTSTCIEKEIGFYLNKEDLILFALDQGLPLEKTWSCYRGTIIPCGKCLPCQGRKKAYKNLKMKEKIRYLTEIEEKYVQGVQKIKSLAKNYLEKIS